MIGHAESFPGTAGQSQSGVRKVYAPEGPVHLIININQCVIWKLTDPMPLVGPRRAGQNKFNSCQRLVWQLQ
jgi:hypothetical protein